MNAFQLKLTRDNYTAEQLFLYERGKQEHLEHRDNSHHIYADEKYRIQLVVPAQKEIKNVRLWINEEPIPAAYNSGDFYYMLENNGDLFSALFKDCYGYVVISVSFLDAGRVIMLSTNNIPVLIKKDSLSESIKEMVRFIYSCTPDLLEGDVIKASSIDDLEYGGTKDIASQLVLAENIAHVYETSYGFFKSNRKEAVKVIEREENSERLQYITPNTTRYVATHPELLAQTFSHRGILVGKDRFFPKRTLTQVYEFTADTYENQVVMSFLKRIYYEINDLIIKIDRMLSELPDTEEAEGDYIYSAYIICENARQILLDEKERFKSLQSIYERLFLLYRRILNVKDIDEFSEPNAVMISVPQYHRIYTCINRWNTYGTYGFGKERFMSSLFTISSLYEYFVLSKLIHGLEQIGFQLTEKKHCVYPKVRKENTVTGNNTFIFNLDQVEVTLYYQPVIYDTDAKHVNGIGLYRNTSISIAQSEDHVYSGTYYMPDYLIKVSKDGLNNYVVGDAKFSTLNTVKSFQVSNLAFKYLVSISPIDNNEVLRGMCIFYGKERPNDVMGTVYDNKLEGQSISPFIEMIPLSDKETKDGDSVRYIFSLLN